jgi:peptidoglycan/xylan/chitin deacetylase (PgdA/CDA1 family)
VPVLALAGLFVAACAIPSGGDGLASPVPSSSAPSTPSPDAQPSASTPSRPFRPTPAPAPTFATHTVRPGDSLIALAARFGTTPESLAYWNRARYPSLDPESPAYRPERIEVGWQLVYLPGEVVDPENLPPASGAPTDEPAPSGPVGPYPTLPADGSAALVRRGPTGLAAVALTFEYAGGAGAGPGGAEAVVQWLAVNGVPATVFLAPSAASPDDGAASATLARLRAEPRIATGVLVATETPSTLAADLQAADTALAAGLGRTTLPLLRPARGTATTAALQAAGGAGWTWAIAWDVDPGDGVDPAAGGPIATDIVARVVSRVEGGSIVRLQLGGARTLEALPGILEGLEAAGLRIAALDELLGLTVPE